MVKSISLWGKDPCRFRTACEAFVFKFFQCPSLKFHSIALFKFRLIDCSTHIWAWMPRSAPFGCCFLTPTARVFSSHLRKCVRRLVMLGTLRNSCCNYASCLCDLRAQRQSTCQKEFWASVLRSSRRGCWAWFERRLCALFWFHWGNLRSRHTSKSICLKPSRPYLLLMLFLVSSKSVPRLRWMSWQMASNGTEDQQQTCVPLPPKTRFSSTSACSTNSVSLIRIKTFKQVWLRENLSPLNLSGSQVGKHAAMLVGPMLVESLRDERSGAALRLVGSLSTFLRFGNFRFSDFINFSW